MQIAYLLPKIGLAVIRLGFTCQVFRFEVLFHLLHAAVSAPSRATVAWTVLFEFPVKRVKRRDLAQEMRKPNGVQPENDRCLENACS
jgi:hypothetical protein